MSYEAIKHIHLTFVLLTVLSFFIRGFWMMTDSPMLTKAGTRVLPHITDTLLLVSGIALAFMASISPIDQPWLAAKIGALLLYIGLGTVALKRGSNKAIRLIAFILSVAVLSYIISVALARSPMPYGI